MQLLARVAWLAARSCMLPCSALQVKQGTGKGCTPHKMPMCAAVLLLLLLLQVSAVSAKTNTTAYSRLGAFTQGAAQVVLYDTPGVVGSQ